MAFNAKEHMTRVQGGREYLEVKFRLVWFREDHPDWGILTSPVEINMEKQYAIFSATIMNAEGKVMATATKAENVRGFQDFIEKAETGAVGRALAYCGYGTQFCGNELDEGARLADAPIERERSAPQSGASGAAACVVCNRLVPAARVQMCQQRNEPVTHPGQCASKVAQQAGAAPQSRDREEAGSV